MPYQDDSIRDWAHKPNSRYVRHLQMLQGRTSHYQLTILIHYQLFPLPNWRARMPKTRSDCYRISAVRHSTSSHVSFHPKAFTFSPYSPHKSPLSSSYTQSPSYPTPTSHWRSSRRSCLSCSRTPSFPPRKTACSFLSHPQIPALDLSATSR